MTKTLTLFLCVLLFPMNRTLAQEIPIDEFRDKLHGLYYDYKKEGMKGFRCQVQSRIFDIQRESSGAKSDIFNDLMQDFLLGMVRPTYQLVYDMKEVKIYSPWDDELKKAQEILRNEERPKKPQETPTQKEENLKALKTFRTVMKKLKEIVTFEIQAWAFLALPLESDQTQVRFTKVLKTSKGYELHGKNGADRGTFYFGPDLKLTQFVYRPKGDKPVTLNTDYEKTSKGWRIRSCDWTYRTASYKSKATYRTVDDYYVPEKIETTFTEGKSKGMSIFDALKFDKYNVDW